MIPKAKVILFDVDGTLVSAAGAGGRAIGRALEEACGPIDGVMAALRLDGKTDRLIVREAFALLGKAFDEGLCDQVLRRYLCHLAEELGPRKCHLFSVLPGVEALLQALNFRGTPYGLCTGNLVEGARRKLARGELDRFFEWGPGAIGGFAEDGEARERLVEAAWMRARARLGQDLAAEEVLVIGDTPRDVEAAHEVGCQALAVATGRFSEEELRATGAEGVVATLDPQDVRSFLVGE